MEINGAQVQETYYYKDMGLSEIGRASCRERV